MITLSNGHKLEYVVASGALGFDGRGWWHERPLVWLGLIQPKLFTVVIKSLSLQPIKGNLCWWKPWTWIPWSPWSCVRFLPGGAVNKVGLTNPGIDWWIANVAPTLTKEEFKRTVVSLYGSKDELVVMIIKLNRFPFAAYEINDSCPNTGHLLSQTNSIVQTVKAAKKVSKHPLILKLSVAQDYLRIAEGVYEEVEAISINSVPWDRVFFGKKSPLEKIGKPGSGKGGVSGKPAQNLNWKAILELSQESPIPVIAPGMMEYADLNFVRTLGAKAVSFGAIHLRTPWKPTSIVRKEIACGR